MTSETPMSESNDDRMSLDNYLEQGGKLNSQRFEQLQRFGLRHTPNEELQKQWEKEVSTLLSEMNVSY